ncbi:MAG: aminopeptidase P N-terminal domain-containing protein [Candidatus Thiodiazotropha sp. (ex Lucinoma aequizonata)]|nr:aminopeptidase P N-terminal domain-containing protein [Candidatus Thiodiazotropha sp. (ex Lucinoma aequizonata)]MCU7889372.1 aminopeptidase P N-terminal domain-containing protein [Candidatus Thiodiazotropha sp. (ex Lucinoma aequizonata)]MCU7894906.1 aminopeptidase P N-terminal domain-containing protein [Candidatus Thiodiazotropha sp. (ex Lucinoma aequizonata)]MCU7898339.1 aminopeptidase P N-terminal domain-containing protein [Candidatus Thiodiazotropha sp. (ex Lucinoma aequizonata)]MCU790090
MLASEFKRRRRELMRVMGPDSIAILATAPLLIRNRDVHYPYRPDSDFYYLTGFPEPEAVLVLIPGRKHAEYILFNRERDPIKEQWDGSRAGQEGACIEYDADDSFPIGDLDDILPRMLEQCERIFYVMDCNPQFDKRFLEWLNAIRCESRNGMQGPVEIIALDHYLHEMRLYKSCPELKVMRQAARISAKAHKKVMQACKAGMWEYQLEAEFVRECSHQGAKAQAYPPIVGAGANGCTLHYIDNMDKVEDQQMLLIDAGCEWDFYASDITRTYPVNGLFSIPQRQLYELVLAAQEAAIAKVKPGNHWNDPHDVAVRTITRGLIKLGILKGSLPKLIREKKYKTFFPHRTGHWIGMDVHDVGDYKVDGTWRLFEPGMALTIEPGLYIPAGIRSIAKKWWNIGIRVEDDVVVTKDGCEVLTKDIAKSVAEIESIMAA